MPRIPLRERAVRLYPNTKEVQMDTVTTSLTRSFVKERETKRTWMFNEVEEVPDEEPVVGSLYVRKTALEQIGNPESLTVIVQAAE